MKKINRVALLPLIGLLLAGFLSHNAALQVAGFIVAIFGAFGGG